MYSILAIKDKKEDEKEHHEEKMSKPHNKVQNPRRNSYAGTGCRHLHQATAYTTALSVTHARKSLPHVSNQQRSVRTSPFRV